jgi:hypothetical protein
LKIVNGVFILAKAFEQKLGSKCCKQFVSYGKVIEKATNHSMENENNRYIYDFLVSPVTCLMETVSGGANLV